MSDFAMKHQMKKRMAKGGMSCPGADCPGCGAAMCMASGGDVKRSKEHHPLDTSRGVGSNPKRAGLDNSGTSVAGDQYRRGFPEYAKETHKKTHEELKSMPKPNLYAEGGDVDGHANDELVMRIMKKRYAHGGEVEPIADFESNDFDEMDKEPAEHFSETGANSGDELGNMAEEDDEKDVVSRIMKSRSKKDRVPRPA